MQFGPAMCHTSENSFENPADETLCRRWRDRHDISAAHQLAKRHRRLVLELAEIYRPSGLPWDDLTGEGQLGLMRAICRFDPDQSVRFATHATWRVAVTLQGYVLKKSPREFDRRRWDKVSDQRGVRLHRPENGQGLAWDGNETLLVVAGVVLWGAFPVVYATLLSALYLPLLQMLAGLILRGVAFEYRSKTERLRWIWDAGFAGGSLAAAFTQGVMVGALVEGLPIEGGYYTGGDFGWLSPFAVLCGVGLCVGYGLLGACWLVLKCGGDIREATYQLIPYLAAGLLAFLLVVFAYALAEDLRVVGRWLERPYLFAFPTIGAFGAVVAADSVRRRRNAVPFAMVALIFLAAFGTLAISFWPYMVPFAITIDEAAAPHASLAFMFWGAGLFVFPLVLLYTAISYAVFRGKLRSTSGDYCVGSTGLPG
jgi:cytochrome bd ubiquinol oxidase subunit II